MLQRSLPYFLTLLLFSSLNSFSQQTKWPKSLLWRISGNGLAKPSYVYGTMHIQDKRVFHFTDSVYKAIENTEGLALEVDFQELIDSMINLGFDREAAEENDEVVKVEEKELDKSIDSVLKNLGIDADKVTAKNLKKIREYRIRRITSHGEMPTVVDGYLFGIALRHGKWTGGIEDVNDQLSLIDEIGGILTPEKAFEPDAKLRASLESMIKVYADSDLEGINNFIELNYDNDYKSKLLVIRNVKMARRMDSLLKWRSMFFAVGAAHLPGDSGVINMLRVRGFEVEPVFSPRTITPENYTSKLAGIPWKTSNDDAFYSVEMPGIATDFDRFGEAVKMRMFFDLPTMTYYMSGHSLRTHDNYSELSESFRDLVRNMGGNSRRLKVKDVSGNGLIGVEGSFEVPEGYYKVRLLQKRKIMYMLMTGSTKKGNLTEKDVDRFFNSFIAKDGPVIEYRFQPFTIAGKDFTVDLPGVPKPNRDIDKSADGSDWHFTTYDLADRDKGLYYMVQVRDILPGRFLEGDTSYFNLFSEELSSSFEIVKKEQFTFQGWNAMKMEFLDMGKLRYHMYTIVRGNRVYTLFAGGQKTNLPEVDTVFGSFRLTSSVTEPWNKHSAHSFTTVAPAAIELQKKEPDEEDEGEMHFISYDPKKAISYEVMITPLPEYYWAESDSAFFQERLKWNREFNDTLLKFENVKNGNIDGVEFLLRKQGSNTVKKVRTFVNGDTVYNLFSIVPEAYADDADTKRFFSGFRLNQEKKPTIYKNKIKELFSALLTKDSVSFAKAADVLNMIKFTKKDLPDLHEAFLRDYEFEHYYETINSHISDELEELEDSSTVAFIAGNYKNIKEDNVVLKYEALDVLASIRTKASYLVLKNLLLSYPLEGEQEMVLAYSLRDSLELTKLLYPEILQLSGNADFSNIIAHVSKTMIDSGFLTLKDLLPYRDVLLSQASGNLQELNEDQEIWWEVYEWPPFIAVFNDTESNRLLQEYLRIENHDIQFSAALALLKNNQPVSKSVMEDLAEDKKFRAYLYEELLKLKRLDVFPPKYATQQKIAESEIYLLAGEDDEYPSSVSFIGERKTTFRGKEGIFYIFKIGFGEGSDVSYHMGITGPYTNTKVIVTDSKAAGVYYESEYSKSDIDEQLQELLKGWEDYYKEYPEN